MYTTPGTVFKNLYLVRWRILLQVLGVIRELSQPLFFDMFQRVSQSHLTIMMMVSVAFTIGRDMHQLRPIPLLRKAADQPISESFAVI